jgi:mono/diheme cytochrome c family protein
MKYSRLLLVLGSLPLGWLGPVVRSAPPANWENHCSSCHGPDGKGNTKNGRRLNIKDLTNAEFQASFTDDRAFKSVKEGLKDKNGKTLMKPIEGVSDEEIAALVAYVRTLVKK